MSIFKDQETFMTACDQSVDKFNDTQYKLYIDLIKEEVQELNDAINDNDLLFTCNESGVPDHMSVCIGGRNCELPERKSKPSP